MEGINTAKDKAFRDSRLSELSSKNLNLIELPYNMQSLLIAEDVREFPDNRYFLRYSEAEIVEKLLKTRKAASALREYGIHYTSSLLLTGAPGTGKTELARYIAHCADVPFVLTRFSGLIDSHLGETQKHLNRVFDYARSTPCVLCIDEIDAVGMSRGNSGDVGEMNRIVIFLMQELDRLSNDVILIGTTNRKDQLDKALLRRFSIVHEVELLSQTEAQTMARMLLESLDYPDADVAAENVVASIGENLAASEINKNCIDMFVGTFA